MAGVARHNLGTLAADRRGAPLIAVGLLIVASLLTQVPGVVAGQGRQAIGSTSGIGTAANPRIVSLNVDAIAADQAQAAALSARGGFAPGNVAPGAANDPPAAGPSDPPASGGDGLNATSDATVAALSPASAFAVDGSLIKPLTIDTSVPPDISSQVRVYTVRSGDTLTGIAHRFGLNFTTIWWANRLDSVYALQIGQKLFIPPVDGVLYTVKDGDTVARVARQFHASPEDITTFNDLTGDTLVLGQEIMVPDGRGTSLPTPSPEPQSPPSVGGGGGGGGGISLGGGGVVVGPCTNCAFGGSMSWPVPGGFISQYFHYGHPALDIAADYGTPVDAAAAGVVVFAGWRSNGGGYQVWMSHGNNIYTTYNHMSAITVGAGEQVSRGQQVGRVGMSGAATGPHCHFEVWIGAIWDGGYRVNPLSYLG
jgi:murein DD-endopeptidase MepM/ murein hydrolase activator NlpD